STITAYGMCTPYEPLTPSLIRLATGEAMPSLARLGATDTIGMPQRVGADVAASIVLPPPMPTTASYDRVRSFAASSRAASRVPPDVVKTSAEPRDGRTRAAVRSA